MEEITGGRYGLKTGICEACGYRMKGHAKCDSCGILLGLGHMDNGISYRGKNLCEGCIAAWQKEEKKNRNRPIPWEKFFTHGWSKAELNR